METLLLVIIVIGLVIWRDRVKGKDLIEARQANYNLKQDIDDLNKCLDLNKDIAKRNQELITELNDLRIELTRERLMTYALNRLEMEKGFDKEILSRDKKIGDQESYIIKLKTKLTKIERKLKNGKARK